MRAFVARLSGVKIDRRFVAAMLGEDREMAVVRMLLGMAHTMRLRVTAEGVETAEQLAALRHLASGRSCFLQGYLISRPMSAGDLQLLWPAGVVVPLALGSRSA